MKARAAQRQGEQPHNMRVFLVRFFRFRHQPQQKKTTATAPSLRTYILHNAYVCVSILAVVCEYTAAVIYGKKTLQEKERKGKKIHLERRPSVATNNNETRVCEAKYAQQPYYDPRAKLNPSNQPLLGKLRKSSLKLRKS